MRKRNSVRRNRFTHILTWALVTVLAVQSFLPSCAYALETGRIQRLAEAIATYRSGSAVAIDAGVTVRTSDKTSGEGGCLWRAEHVRRDPGREFGDERGSGRGAGDERARG